MADVHGKSAAIARGLCTRVLPDSAGRHAALPAALSTVYHLRFSDLVWQPLAITDYSMSNHALIRLACIAGIPWLDWRRTCHADGDHAHPMEPSVRGDAPTSPGRSPRRCASLMSRWPSQGLPLICGLINRAWAIDARMPVSARMHIQGGTMAGTWDFWVDHEPCLMAAYRSPMASMMTAASTVRTIMTPWRAGATHPHASAGRRCGAQSGLVRSHHQPPDPRPHHPLRTRPCARSRGMSPPRCPCSPVSHNNHSL